MFASSVLRAACHDRPAHVCVRYNTCEQRPSETHRLCCALLRFGRCSGAERLRADASAARRCAEEIDDSPSAEDSDSDEFLYNWCVENGVP